VKEDMRRIIESVTPRTWKTDKIWRLKFLEKV